MFNHTVQNRVLTLGSWRRHAETCFVESVLVTDTTDWNIRQSNWIIRTNSFLTFCGYHFQQQQQGVAQREDVWLPATDTLTQGKQVHTEFPGNVGRCTSTLDELYVPLRTGSRRTTGASVSDVVVHSINLGHRIKPQNASILAKKSRWAREIQWTQRWWLLPQQVAEAFHSTLKGRKQAVVENVARNRTSPTCGIYKDLLRNLWPARTFLKNPPFQALTFDFPVPLSSSSSSHLSSLWPQKHLKQLFHLLNRTDEKGSFISLPAFKHTTPPCDLLLLLLREWTSQQILSIS